MNLVKSTLCVFTTILSVNCQEIQQPASVLGPRNFNHHSYEAAGFFSTLSPLEPTKQGPVLFPNDAPPPPRPPLIVTSRPLLEQIARSELNPTRLEQNNSIAEQSQISGVHTKPNYLARIKQYSPYSYIAPTPSPVILVDSVTGKPLYSETFRNYPDEYKHPYADVVRKSQILNASRDRGHRYNDYEEHSVLPPIYKALSDHANEKVLKIQQKQQRTYPYPKYEIKEPDYTNELHNNDYEDAKGEYNKGKKYAFSYSVKDHKTGDDFSHTQHSSGQATNGEYRVRLPDGRMQIVSYIADENGYKADVRYDEEKTVENSIDYKNYYKEPKKEKEPSYTPKGEDYYQYADISKEYANDYVDYTDRHAYDYNPNNLRKFAAFEPEAKKVGVIIVPNQIKSTIKPSYNELKPLFVTKKPQTQTTEAQNYVPFEINVPSTTRDPMFFNDFTTERVVLIGGPKTSLYTSVRNSYPSIPVTTPLPLLNSVTPFVFSSTVSPGLTKNVQITNDKAILSSSFLDRINKYLSFN